MRISAGFIALCLFAASVFADFSDSTEVESQLYDRDVSEDTYISFTPTSGPSSVALLSGRTTADIVADQADWPGVLRAAKDLQSDFQRVNSGRDTPRLLTTANGTISGVKPSAIIVGTIGRSSLISALVAQKKIDVSAITGKWESFQVFVVNNVVVGRSSVASALVIAGSDKRGSIYGIYDLSEQIGVSPWYWWADAVPVKRSQIYANLRKTYSQGEPSVKYRGIFLNDEQPALTNWLKEKIGPVFNSQFYVKVFELLLRLKANYLWPTMWDSMFAVDDVNNQRLADEYGIVMSTSHQEPMMRATKEWWTMGNSKWNYTTNSDFLKTFWEGSIKRAAPYESYVTLGMRGDGDLPYTEELAVAVQQQIIKDQREILAKYHNGTSNTGQVWCLYKEVQGYYENGMRVPDDVTLLWVDDNWGNVRRLPIADEVSRKGGAGIYYHFDYVGDPRSYKWINTNDLTKVYEQLSLAKERRADQIFIVNVGDLKPMELPIDFFMTFAWDHKRYTHNTIDKYLEKWAMREFQVDRRTAQEVAKLVATYTKFNSRRKPELIDVNTYSNIYFNEAENVVADWKDLEDRALKVYRSLPEEIRPAYFQLVLHPIQASSVVTQIYINIGKNNLYSSQVRNSANVYADEAEKLLDRDEELTTQYHTLLGGKWNHMMDQTHLNYQYWQQPMRNTLPAMNRLNSDERALPGPLGIAVEGLKGAWPGDNQFQCAQGYNCPPPGVPQMSRYGAKTRWVDVFNRYPGSIPYTATASAGWIKLSSTRGTFSGNKQEERVFISVDWSKVPAGTDRGFVVFNSTAVNTQAINVTVPIVIQSAPAGFKGHVEADGYVSIEAEHFSRNVAVENVQWTVLPNYGKTLSALTPFPRTSKAFAAGSGPVLEYNVHLFTAPANGKLGITSYLAPSLNQDPQRSLKYAISVDNGTPIVVQPIPDSPPGGKLPSMWGEMVASNIILSRTEHPVAQAGAHTVKFWMVEPNIILEKIVLNITNTVPNTYLGPPESFRI